MGPRHYDLRLRLGTAASTAVASTAAAAAAAAPGLSGCAGKVPSFDGTGDAVQVQWSWQSAAGNISYTLTVASGSPSVYVRGWGASNGDAYVELAAGSHVCTLIDFR